MASVPNYRKQGGAEWVIGGDLSVESGGSFTLKSGGAMDTPGFMKVASGTLTAGDADAFAFAWQNPESSKVIVHRVIVDVTTAGGTPTSVLDVGVVASATATADTLIDGADLDATAVYDNIDDQGANGKSKGKLDENGGTNDHITGKILVANAASLAGKYYIFYTAV